MIRRLLAADFHGVPVVDEERRVVGIHGRDRHDADGTFQGMIGRAAVLRVGAAA